MPIGFVVGDQGLGASGDTHPDWRMAHAVAGPHLVVGASAVGQIHLARGLPRDDAFMVRSVGRWLALGVADGVGSRPFSRYGATYAVEALTAMLLRQLVPSLETVSAELGAAPSPSALSKLAPPSTVEEVELKPRLVDREGSLKALEAGLREWTEKVPANAEPPATSSPPHTFQQAASVGWWPFPSSSDQGDGPEPPQATSTAVGQDQDVPENEPHPPPDEPNLAQVMRQAFEKTHLGLRQHAGSLDLELADLSCTALALLLDLETGRVAVGQVGDGALLGLTAQGEVEELLKAPDTGDPQSVYTLNRPNFEKYLTLKVIEPPGIDSFVAFYVMTDGLSGDLLYSPRIEALRNWARDVDRNLHLSPSPAQAAAGMLNWLATYQVTGSWDDRTLVVITRQRERNNGDDHPGAGQPEPAQPTDD